MNSLERWDELRQKSDDELRAVYADVLSSRIQSDASMSPALRDRNLELFDKFPREQRIYYITMSEMVLDNKRRNGACGVKQERKR